MKKLLKHLTNVPVAIALAFLLVGAPGAPMAKMLPSFGDAMAMDYGPCMMTGTSFPDSDCDGWPDYSDPCPYDPSNTCYDADSDGWA